MPTKRNIAIDVNCNGNLDLMRGYSDWNHLIYRTGSTSGTAGINAPTAGITACQQCFKYTSGHYIGRC